MLGFYKIHVLSALDLSIVDLSFTLGLKLQIQLQNTEAFQSIRAKLSDRGLPGTDPGSLYSTEYLEKFVRSQTLTGHHPTSTCRMGPAGDSNAVVDSELKSVSCSYIFILGQMHQNQMHSHGTYAGMGS